MQHLIQFLMPFRRASPRLPVNAWRVLHVLLVSLLLACSQPAHTLTAPASLLTFDGLVVFPGSERDPKTALNAPAELMTPFVSGLAIDVSDGRVAWLRMRAAPAPQLNVRVLELPTMGIDRITLHTWVAGEYQPVQISGDQLPVAHWTHRSTVPTFELVEAPGVEHVYVLEVSHRRAMRLRVLEFDPIAHRERTSALSIAVGLALGGCLFMALMSLVYGRVVADQQLMLFAGWAVLVTLVMATVSGVSGFYLWPEWPRHNSWTGSVLSHCGLAVFTLIVRQSTSIRYRTPVLRRVLNGLLVGHLVAIAVACLPESTPLRTGFGRTFHIFSAAVDVYVLFAAVRRGDLHARWLMAARVWLVLPAMLTIARNQGWSDGEVSRLVFLFVALGAAQLLTLVALLVRNRASVNHMELLSQLKEIDPDTGLMKSALFEYQLEREVRLNTRVNSNSAVLLVGLVNPSESIEVLDASHQRSVVQQIATALKGGLARMDEATRLTNGRFAVLVLDAHNNDAARESAMRLLAKLLAVRTQLGLPVAPRFHVGFAVLGADVESTQVLDNLQALLDSKRHERKLAIFDLSKESTGGYAAMQALTREFKSTVQ